jgi:hypothetical protein
LKYLRQATAQTVVVGPFVAVADGATPVTTLTTGSTLNGRAVSNGTGAAYAPATFAHDANGYYLAPLAVGDVPAVGRFRLEFSGPLTYFPVWEDFAVLAAAVYDALFGTAALSTLGLDGLLSAPRVLDAAANAAITLNDALWCAVAEGAGRKAVVGQVLAKKTPDGTATIRNLTLDSTSNPTALS